MSTLSECTSMWSLKPSWKDQDSHGSNGTWSCWERVAGEECVHAGTQVILKPDPGRPQELYLGSLAALGIDTRARRIPIGGRLAGTPKSEHPRLERWSCFWHVPGDAPDEGAWAQVILKP